MNESWAFVFRRQFVSLFGTQFLGAFNDNFFKTLLFSLISFYGLGNNPWLPANQMLNLATLLFVLPYFVFSAWAGELATFRDKAQLSRWVKMAEVAIMLLASIGFVCSSAAVLLLCLLLMGIHSTLFGPIKYAILPQYLRPNDLLMGNSLIESGTFMAILLGQILGTHLADLPPLGLSATVLFIAVLGWLFSLFMPSTPTIEPTTPIDHHICRNTMRLLRQTHQQRDLKRAIIGISWFWFAGAIYTTQLSTLVRQQLLASNGVFTLMLALFSVGTAIGAIGCGKLSRGQLRLNLVVCGGLGMGVFGALLAVFGQSHAFTSTQTTMAFLAQPAAYGVIVSILGLGVFGGLFSVPLYTWLQVASSDDFRAQAVAANNIINGLFMVASALISVLLLWLFKDLTGLYALVSLGHCAVSAWLWRCFRQHH